MGRRESVIYPRRNRAAAVQNIGAYGAEIADIIRQVYCYDTIEEEFVHFNVNECKYGYRESMFKSPEARDRYIVTNVILALTRERRPRLEYGNIRTALSGALGVPAEEVDGSEALTPALIRDVIIGIRREKLPEVSEIGSAGSFSRIP